ncbi:MAG TPA: DUF58 domain-containing protein [Solirubrobacteraceae bacterium]
MNRGPGALALGLVLCLLAGAFGAFSLYIPGIALVLLWALAEASVRLAARRAGIAREPVLASAEEGTPLTLTVTVTGGASRLPLAGGELVRWPGAGPEPLGRLRGQPASFVVRPSGRGRQTIAPSELRFGDPLGICTRSLSSHEAEVLVLPRVERIDRAALAQILGADESGRRHAAAEVDALRPYRPGAPASRIHWRTAARTGVLMERSLSAEKDRLPLIVLDARRPADGGTLDMAVRATASLCLGIGRLGGCRLLLPGEQRAQRLESDLSSWPGIHERLALVCAGSPLARTAYEHAGIVLWVTASLTADPMLGRRGAGGGYFRVSPFTQEDRPVLMHVAGCTLQPIRQSGAARAVA